MDIITGYIGEPHISSEQDRDINIGIVGEGSYVLATGLQMEPEVQTGNEVRIKDGVIMHQGCAASIKKNTYDSVMIANGSQGMKRTDLIVARYKRDAETNIESMNWVVIQGTPAETDPVVPEYVSGDIQAGDTVADMPMYKVHLDGLNITSIEKVFTVVNGLKELNSNSLKWLGYVDLSEKTSRIDNGTSQRLTYTYDVPEGTKYVLPLLKSCNWGSVGDTNYSNLLNGSFTATLVNISGDPHEITAKYRLIFLG